VRRVRRGVYCVDSARRPSFEESVVAALLVLPAGSVAAGPTAGRLWRFEGLPPNRSGEPLEFLVRGRPGSARHSGCCLRFQRFTSVDLPDGVPATSQPRTLLDLVAGLGFADGLALVEGAARRDPSLMAAVVREQAQRVTRRGSNMIDQVLAVADVLSESVLESRARALWLEAALPPPTQQAVIRRDGRFVARVDFLWESARLIVEVDGMAKYDDPYALRDEKRRQNELVALGYTVLRFTWADIVGNPARVVAQVQQALRAAS
jgi:very-short-patch-repair endonuclease